MNKYVFDYFGKPLEFECNKDDRHEDSMFVISSKKYIEHPGCCEMVSTDVFGKRSLENEQCTECGWKPSMDNCSYGHNTSGWIWKEGVSLDDRSITRDTSKT